MKSTPPMGELRDGGREDSEHLINSIVPSGEDRVDGCNRRACREGVDFEV